MIRPDRVHRPIVRQPLQGLGQAADADVGAGTDLRNPMAGVKQARRDGAVGNVESVPVGIHHSEESVDRRHALEHTGNVPHVKPGHVPFYPHILNGYIWDMSQRLIDRIDSLILASGQSERSLLLAAGAGPDLIRDLRRKRGSPTLETIEKLALALGVAPGWLAFENGPKAAQREVPRSLIPVLGQVAAGAWHEIDDGVDEPRTTRKLVADPRFPASAQYGLSVVGESMNLLFSDQDLLLCLDFNRMADGPQPRHDDIVIVEQLRDGGLLRECSAKQLRITPEGPVLEARSSHPKWAGFRLAPSTLGDQEGSEVTIKALVLRSERHWWAG
jgi:SOS-response transcriptional repressor LexA